MYVTLRMQKTKELVNNPISDEALELIGERGTGPVFVGFADKMTQTPMKNWLKAAGITKKIKSRFIAADIHSVLYRWMQEQASILFSTCWATRTSRPHRSMLTWQMRANERVSTVLR